MNKVLFCGIGAMGEPMVANLLKKGFAVTIVQNRRPEPAARLAALGARVVTRAIEGAAECDVVVLSLPTSREVEQVLVGPDGIEASLKSGAMVLDTTTGDPQTTRMLSQRLASKRVDFVDAGMTRGVDGAKKGTLAFFIGGERADIDKVQPVLAAMGDTFLHCGPVGQGHTVKVISNILSYGTVALVNEALMLGARNGVGLDILHQCLMQGAPSKALETFGKRIADAQYAPARVTVEHVCEDMLLGQKLAASATAPIFLVAAAQEIYRLLDAQGKGAQDMAIIGELWRGATKSGAG